LQLPDARQRLDQYRPKRSKPEEETGALGPQCDRSKILCRTATHLETEVNIETGVVDLRGDETKMNL
jgi:hypothetical protein